MKGLLLKDIIGMKVYARMGGLFALMAVAMTLISGGTMMISSVLLVLCAMIPMTATALDEQAKWNAYAQCMPVTRNQLVLSKYLLSVLMTAVAMVLYMLLTLLGSIQSPVVWSDVIAVNLLISSLLLAMNALTLPVLYRFGVEKTRIIIMLVYMGAMFIFITFLNADMQLEVSFESFPLWILPIIAIVLTVISYFISCAVYEKKEL